MLDENCVHCTQTFNLYKAVGNLYNSADAKIKLGGDIGVDGNVENNGTIVIDPETELWANDNFRNSGRIRIYGGQCESGEILDNDSTGVIQGVGVVWAEGLVNNKSEIYAPGGSLAIVSEGSVTNTGALVNKPLSTLNIQPVEDTNKLAAYFGIVPRVFYSNEIVRHSGITKNGSKIGRTTLFQCTLVAKRYNPYLHRYYERIKCHRGSGKAIIATARKFLGMIYQTLKNDWIFEDFPNFVIANT